MNIMRFAIVAIVALIIGRGESPPPEIIVKESVVIELVYPTIEQMREIIHLSQIAGGEAVPESYIDAASVIDAVEYRSERDSSTIYEVISERGQFDGFKKNSYFDPEDHHIDAAINSVLSDENVLPEGTVYFYNPVTSTDKNWINRLNRIGEQVLRNEHPTNKRYVHVYFKLKD